MFEQETGGGKDERCAEQGFGLQNGKQCSASRHAGWVQPSIGSRPRISIGRARSHRRRFRIIFLNHFTPPRILANLDRETIKTAEAKTQEKASRFTARRMRNDVFT
jgi:hypothetical protein